MQLKDLIALYREEAQDNVKPYFCSDPLLTVYANQAQVEACRRGQLITDSTSPAARLAYSAGDESVKASPLITKILRASVNGQPIATIDVAELDCIYPGWQNDSAMRQPTHLVAGMQSGKYQLWPKPSEAGEIVLTVRRLPCPMTALTDCPEIREETHHALVGWMLYRAYSRLDGDRYEPTKAAEGLARFEAEFGAKVSGRNEEWSRQNDPAGWPEPIA